MPCPQVAVNETMFQVPDCLPPRRGDTGTIAACIIGDRIAFGAERNNWWHIRKICVVQRVSGWIIGGQRAVLVPDAGIILHVFEAEHWGVGVGLVAAFGLIAAQTRIEQKKPECGCFAAQSLRNCSRKAAACRIACQQVGAGLRNCAGYGKRIIIPGRVWVFWCEAVIDADDRQARASTDFSTDIVVAVKPTYHKSAAMKVDQGWG